jgi:hypothetical protein
MCNQNIKTVNSNESEQVKIIMKLKMFNKKLEYHVENVKALKNIKTIKFYENFNRNSNVSHKNASNISKHYIF